MGDRKQLKIVAISDTHSLHRKFDLPEGDVLIHAGDFTARGTRAEFQDFNDWLGDQPHKYKIVVAGNHDLLAERDKDSIPEILSNCTYLVDSAVEIEGYKFYGAPWSWSDRGSQWAFKLYGNSAADVWAKIPDDTDVLITHGPPHGYMDEAPVHYLQFDGPWVNTGDPYLAKRLRDMWQSGKFPQLHIFGHIHEGYGLEMLPKAAEDPSERRRMVLANVASLTPRYEPLHAPVELILG